MATVRRLAFARLVTGLLATGSRLTWSAKLLLAIALFLISFGTKSLHAIDLAPLMHTSEQPARGMSEEYNGRAVSILQGHGLLIPDDQDPTDTLLLAHAPGYSILLSGIYYVAGRSYLGVQAVQNVINSISPVLIFLIAGNLLGWRVGVVAGLLTAISHHLSYYSNFVLPDSVCALPILIAVYCLVRARRHRCGSLILCGLAGVMIGLSSWLRANPLLLGLFVAAVLPVVFVGRQKLFLTAVILAFFSFAVIAPITIRNYLIYGEFVPIRIGVGINLWEGLGDVSDGRFGAMSDQQVILEEEARYREPRYGSKWSTPDGIKRDQDRVRRSLEIIRERPLWFMGSMFIRMNEMLKYSAHAPLVFRTKDVTQSDLAARAGSDAKPEGVMSSEDDDLMTAGFGWLQAGRAIHWLRLPVRSLQRIAKETALFFMPIGAVAVLLACTRRGLILLLVPTYYFLFQSMLHTEFRYTLPMHYFLFVFVATGWVLVGAGIWHGARSLKRAL